MTVGGREAKVDVGFWAVDRKDLFVVDGGENFEQKAFDDLRRFVLIRFAVEILFIKEISFT